MRPPVSLTAPQPLRTASLEQTSPMQRHAKRSLSAKESLWRTARLWRQPTPQRARSNRKVRAVLIEKTPLHADATVDWQPLRVAASNLTFPARNGLAGQATVLAKRYCHLGRWAL